MYLESLNALPAVPGKVCLKMGRARLVSFACWPRGHSRGTSLIDGIARPSPFGRAAYPEEVWGVFHWCLMGVFHWCLMGVFHWCLMGVLWVFDGCFIGVLWVFYRCFMGVLWVFDGCFIGVLWVFYGCFIGVAQQDKLLKRLWRLSSEILMGRPEPPSSSPCWMTKVESQTWRVLKAENGRTPSNEFKDGTESSNMFKYVQICSNMFKYVQICSNMFKFSLAKVWTMVAGGGASVVYSDTVAVRSLDQRLVNWCLFLCLDPVPVLPVPVPPGLWLGEWVGQLWRIFRGSQHRGWGHGQMGQKMADRFCMWVGNWKCWVNIPNDS